MIKHVKPTFEVSVGAGFFCIIDSRVGNVINYQSEVWRLDVIKTLGITPTVNDQPIWASGIMFDHIVQVTGAEISTGVVALPSKLLNEIEGATEKDGFTINRTNDLEKEFAFGYWGENRDGTMVFYWHPVCKIAPSEETKNTRTDDPPDPEKSYTITVMPFGDGGEGGTWRVRYDQGEAKAQQLTPLTIDQFFAKPIYSMEQIPDLISQTSTP